MLYWASLPWQERPRTSRAAIWAAKRSVIQWKQISNPGNLLLLCTVESTSIFVVTSVLFDTKIPSRTKGWQIPGKIKEISISNREHSEHESFHNTDCSARRRISNFLSLPARQWLCCAMRRLCCANSGKKSRPERKLFPFKRLCLFTESRFQIVFFVWPRCVRVITAPRSPGGQVKSLFWRKKIMTCAVVWFKSELNPLERWEMCVKCEST